MNCTECKELMITYVESLLAGSEKQLMESHLADCPPCRAEMTELTALRDRLAANASAFGRSDLEDKVLNRIIREQSLKLKQADRINRQLQIWRTIMKSRISKFAAAAAIIIAVVLSINIFDKPIIPTASAADVLQDAIDAVSDIWSVHMKARMRTLPHDNFANIGLDYDFVPIEMWKHTDENGLVQWRVEKPGRVLLMDGQTTTMLIRPNRGVLREKPLPLGCYDSWSGRLLNVHDLLDNELQKAKSNPDREVHIRHQDVEGKDKLVLEIDVTTDIAEDEYLRNKFISESDHLKVYRFDSETKLLESLQVYVHTKDEDVLIFEVTKIEYNMEIDDGVFALDLPENMIWFREPEILPDNERYENMTPKEVAETFFQACAEENWEEVLKFWGASRVDDRIKAYLGGIEIISLGEPFKSGRYPGWFIPYEIKLKSGHIKKHNLAVRNDNRAKRYKVDGGI